MIHRSSHSSRPGAPSSAAPSSGDAASVPNVLRSDDRVSSSSDDAVVDAPDEPPVDLDQLADLLASVLQREGIPAHAEASLILVDPDAIATLKVEYLDGDGAATDVLSFPIDGADGGPVGRSDGDPVGSAGSWMVGDVVLCPVVAATQAASHAGSIEDELALLVVHGGLHLVGWDHEEDVDRHAMWARERELMTELHRAPARDPWIDTPVDHTARKA